MLNKKLKQMLRLFVLVVASFSFSSCFLFSTIIGNENAKKTYLNLKEVKVEDFGSPENHTLAFGTGIIGSSDMLLAIQIDPAGKHVRVTAGFLGGEAFFFAPLEKNLDMQVVHSRTVVGGGNNTTVYSINYPIGERPPYAIRFKTTKPGLLYLGNYETNSGVFSPEKKDYELDGLKRLKAHFEKTDWEPVIDARIKELEK